MQVCNAHERARRLSVKRFWRFGCYGNSGRSRFRPAHSLAWAFQRQRSLIRGCGSYQSSPIRSYNRILREGVARPQTTHDRLSDGPNIFASDDASALVFVVTSSRMGQSDLGRSSLVYRICSSWRVVEPISLPTLWEALLLAGAAEGFHAETNAMARLSLLWPPARSVPQCYSQRVGQRASAR